MRPFARFYFIAVVIALSLISCAKKPGQALFGKWQEQDGREVIGFMKNGSFQGTMIWDLRNTPLDISGTYTSKGDLIDQKVENPGSLTPMTWKVTFSGSDQLTIVYQQGGTLKLDGSTLENRRVKQ